MYKMWTSLETEMNLDKSKCAYKGLGCAKEDACFLRGEEMLKCNLRPYMLFLDNFGPDAEVEEALPS